MSAPAQEIDRDDQTARRGFGGLGRSGPARQVGVISADRLALRRRGSLQSADGDLDHNFGLQTARNRILDMAKGRERWAGKIG